jgi:predicted aspartyl protease
MESFIIQDFKFFTSMKLGEKNTFAHLDTGATGNMLAASESEGLEQIESRVIQGGMGQQEVKQVQIDTLEFLGKSFTNQTAVVIDGEAYFGDVPFPVSMTLGADVLLAHPLIIDFKRMWMGYAEKPLKEDLLRFTMETPSGLPFIKMHFGAQEVNTIFDTGAGYSILNANHAEELGAHMEQVYALEVLDPAGGKGEIPIYRVEDLRMGDLELGFCEAFVVSLEPIEERLGKRIDFVLGANTMLASVWVWVLDKSQNAVLISERSIDVYA